MKTLQFPTYEDRINIHNYINKYAHGKILRNDMMIEIASIVHKYKLDRMPIFNYTVRILQNYSGLPIIHIESSKISDNCPICKSTLSRYLRTEREYFNKDYHIVSATCLDCGCVYLSKGYVYKDYLK